MVGGLFGGGAAAAFGLHTLGEASFGVGVVCGLLLSSTILNRLYRRLSFGLGLWAFTFSYAAAATLALEWISITRPPGATAGTVLVLVLITAFIGTFAARTVLLALRGQLLPAAPQTARSVHVA